MRQRPFGIDLDGCTINFTEFVYLPILEELTGKKFTIDDVTDFDFCICLGISAEEDKAVWESDLLFERMATAPAFVRGLELLNSMNGRPKIIVTARGLPMPHIPGSLDPKWGEKVKEATLISVERNGIPYDWVVFEKDKAKVAIEQDTSEFIEDHPGNAMALAEAGVSVILPQWKYNQLPKHKLIKPVENWY